MLLEALKTYADGLDAQDQLPAGYGRVLIRYVIDLNEDGRQLGVAQDATTGEKGRAGRGVQRPAPALTRSGTKPAPILLVDNAEYALGRSREGSRPEQVAQRHAAFVDLARECAEASKSPEAGAVVAFLNGLAQTPAQLPPGFDPAANVTFRVNDRFVVDVPEVRAFWGAQSAELSDPLECLLCGETRPALRLMPFNFKGIPGGQTSGSALISANNDAFESYGLTQSRIAPLCFACGDGAHKGLQALRDNPTTHLRRGSLEYVFWTRGSTDFNPLLLLENPEPNDVRELLRAAATGLSTSVPSVDPARFYAISLVGNAARVVVRDWLDVTVAEAQVNLARFFKLQRLAETGATEEPKPLSVRSLAQSTTRAGSDEPPSDILAALYAIALRGGLLPLGLAFAAIRRLRAEGFPTEPKLRWLNRTRAALIKMVLLSQPDSEWKEEDLVSLDKDERRPAYLCGRLLAVLEDAQRQALGDVNATIVDRFYGSASSTPIAVFGRLVRGAQPHLARLRRDRYPAYVGLQNALQEILAGLPSVGEKTAFPSALNLEGQGLFALGYYHQRAERFARRETTTQASNGGTN